MVSRSLGIAFSPLERRRELIVELATLAETCGYDQVALGEGWSWDVHLMLAEIAAATENIKLVSTVVSVYSRSAASIAMSAATLSVQTDGRYLLGLGASSEALTEGFHDVDYVAPVRHLRRSVRQTRALLQGERHELSREARALRLGVDRIPPVPIYIAALAPRALRAAGELAEGWLPFLVPPEQLGSFIEAMGEGRSARPPELTKTIRVAPAIPTIVSQDEGAARTVMEKFASTYLLAMGEFYGPFLERIGFETEVAAIRAANTRPSDGVVPPAGQRLLEQQTIFGTRDRAQERLAEWYRLGADEPLLMLPPGAPAELLRETVESMAASG
ncbi:MAG: LLM class flavin-dependent oxidoreductase [Gaiellaceae bacterium]